MSETGMMADIAAVTDNNRGYYPYPPMMYGGYGNGFGGDWIWVILLAALFGGFGGGFGGFGGYGGAFGGLTDGGLLGYAIGNNATKGDLNSVQLQNGISDLSNQVTAGFANNSTQLCGGFADVQNSLCNGFNSVNTNLLQGFGATQLNACQNTNNIVSALKDCCCENRQGISDLKYTVATENCADRAALSNGIRDVLVNQTANTQKILDVLCQDKIDAKNETIANLRQELLYSRGQASQIAQTGQILAGQTAEVDALYRRLADCPVPSMPVYGMTPIFSCNRNNGCGCNGYNQFLG